MSNLKLARQFNSRVKKKFEKAKAKRESVVINASKEILEEIIEDTPRDTGYLASQNKLEILKNEIIFSNDAKYANDVEYNHVSFFRINLNPVNILEKIKDKLRK
ncbi:hypothetical protein KY334_05185 [Candidatus Woesearchaeota archaeon]|nr:hypothetical protein [Candidatus Woesearchaeota archaeon]